MKAAWKRTVAGIFLWSALAGLPAAQEAEGTTWEAWKGTPAPWKSPAEAERTVTDYRAWLAELRVKLMTGRAAELPGWEEHLETIRLHATSVSGLPAQRELLVEVTRARAQALAIQGRFDEARAALDAVLFAPGDPAAAKLALVSAPPALVKLAQAALADPALEEVRSDLAPTAQAGPAQEDGLDERLRVAVAAGKFDLLKQVGARAAPVLEQAVAENLEYLPEATVQDPFAVLVEVNQRRAAAFALAHVDAGASFRLRVVRAMEGLEVLRDSPSAWESTKLAGPRAAVVPEWLGVLARLLGYRDSAGNALGLVGQVISADGLTPEVTRALTAALQGKDGDVVPELMESLSFVEPGKESAEELFEFLLQHEDPRVRRVAAQHLTELGDLPALLERADDPDVLVRRMVALAIGAEGKRAAPASDERALATLRALIQDPEVEVRRAAVMVARYKPLAPEVYRAALRDPDPWVRAQLAGLRHPDEALVRDVLLALAQESEERVRREVDKRLKDPATWERPQAALPAAQQRLADPAWTKEQRTDLVRRLCSQEAGLIALFDTLENPEEVSLAKAIFDEAGYFSSSTGGRMRALLVLDDATLARAYAQVYGASRDLFEEFDNQLEGATPRRRAAMLAVLEDAAAPVYVRLRAAAHAAEAGGARFQEAWLALLAGDPLRSSEPAVWELTAIQRALDSLPDDDRNPLALAALRNDALHDRVRARLAGSYVPRGPLARELTLGILARWGGAADDRAALAVSTALKHLRALPEDVDPALLERALQNPAYAEAALATITALQDARYLPALEGALASDDQRTQGLAVEALTAFPGDEATEILLRAAAGGSQEMRRHSMMALTTRRTMEEQRRLWQDSKESRLERADAVQRLLAQLRDADAVVRAQAARALGTLGALETLPVLIDLLKDKDPGVRQAASAALERLNAVPGQDG